MIKKEEFGLVNDFIEWFRRAKNGLVMKERDQPNFCSSSVITGGWDGVPMIDRYFAI